MNLDLATSPFKYIFVARKKCFLLKLSIQRDAMSRQHKKLVAAQYGIDDCNNVVAKYGFVNLIFSFYA